MWDSFRTNFRPLSPCIFFNVLAPWTFDQIQEQECALCMFDFIMFKIQFFVFSVHCTVYSISCNCTFLELKCAAKKRVVITIIIIKSLC